MDCFRRFLYETKARSGQWLYDRYQWTWRQTSCLIFRFGSLEFECKRADDDEIPERLNKGDAILSVHIPSDADLSSRALAESYRQAEQFYQGIGQKFSVYGTPQAVICRSWLLAPALEPFLAEDSGIRRFREDYDLFSLNEEDESFYEWLFNDRRQPDTLPQDSSLQRKVKSFLLEGGKIGLGRGEQRYFTL